MSIININEQVEIRAILDRLFLGHDLTEEEKIKIGPFLDTLISHYEVWEGGKTEESEKMRNLRDKITGNKRKKYMWW